MDIKTSVYYVHLTRLIAREDFIKFTRRESTRTYRIGSVHGITCAIGTELRCQNVMRGGG
jgi:hypothetical protein